MPPHSTNMPLPPLPSPFIPQWMSRRRIWLRSSIQAALLGAPRYTGPAVYLCPHTGIRVPLTRRYTQGLQCICVRILVYMCASHGNKRGVQTRRANERILVYMCASHGNTSQGVVLSHGNLLHQMLDNSYSGVAAVRSYTPLLHASRYTPLLHAFLT